MRAAADPHPLSPFGADRTDWGAARMWEEEPRTAENRRAWAMHLRTLRDLHAANPDQVRPEYRAAFEALAFTSDAIPTLADLNRFLAPFGWRAAHVIGMVPDRAYQALLAARIFPIARHIRGLHEMDLVPVPDFLHDVFGHIPMLACPIYRRLVNLWAQGALAPLPAWAGEEAAARRTLAFARFYTWAIEFGVVGNAARPLEIFGAAILSAPGEWRNVAEGRVRLEPFRAESAEVSIDYNVVQPRLFVAEDLCDYIFELGRLDHGAGVPARVPVQAAAAV